MNRCVFNLVIKGTDEAIDHGVTNCYSKLNVKKSMVEFVSQNIIGRNRVKVNCSTILRHNTFEEHKQ